MHLTGLKPAHRIPTTTEFQSSRVINDKLTASDFYKRCLAHKLSKDDFVFSADGTTSMKLDVLPFIICKNLSANMIGNFNSPHPKLYTEKVAGGTKAYIGFIMDKISKEYVPNTVVKEDIRKNVTDYVRVIAVYRKEYNEKVYKERVYITKKFDWSGIEFPPDFSYLAKQHHEESDSQKW